MNPASPDLSSTPTFLARRLRHSIRDESFRRVIIRTDRSRGRNTIILPAFVLLLFIGLLLPAPVPSQELRDGPGGEPPLTLPRLDGEITLDGHVGERAWESAASLEPVMHLPDFGASPSERTEFLVGYDDEYLYFACRAHDSEPDRVRINSLQRDLTAYETDACVLFLDLYNDGENSVMFLMTPASVRSDWTFANDASDRPNRDWDTFWAARGTRTEWGWSGEMRLPFSSLRFQSTDRRVVMGFSVARTISRKNETQIHPAIPPRWGPSSIAKPTQLRKLVMEDVEGRNAAHVTPYGLGGTGHSDAKPGLESEYVRTTDNVAEAGLDVKYGLTRNLTLDLTANTDFAQVEADDQQVNLTRFSLFFPEKRRFFQERSATFEFPLGGQERLFHSRRIGLVRGNPVRIFGGARLVGRPGEWDVGFLNMQTAEAEIGTDTFPSENMGVLRLRRRVLNNNSYVGGLITSRIGIDGGYNVVYGTDAVVRIAGQDYLIVNWAQSFDDADGGLGTMSPPGFFDRSLLRVNLERRGTDGWLYGVDVSRAGSRFEPDLGFLLRRDYTKGDLRLGYGWRPGSGSTLNRYSVEIDGSGFRRNEEGTIQSASAGLKGEIESRGGHTFTAEVSQRYEDLLQDFELAESAAVPEGSYRFPEASLSYRPPFGWTFGPRFSVEGGRYFDGDRFSLSVDPSWSVSRHLRLEGTYRMDHVRFDDRGERFTAHIARFRTELMFSTTLSALAFVQYNSAEERVITNFRIHYNPQDGNDLYLVWNEGLNADGLGSEDGPPLSDRRAVMLKYAHTFSFSL